MNSDQQKEIPFGDLLAEPLRNGLTRPRRVRGDGSPMVNMGELFAFRRISDEVEMERVRLNERHPERDLLAAHDLLFARQSIVAEGAGKASIFLGASERVTFESHLIRARIDTTKADPYWLFYFFESPSGRNLVQSIVNQVAAAGIRGSELARLPIPCPDLSWQRTAASVLRALDEKIDSNRRLAALVEETAATLFQARFVDFVGVEEFEESEIGPVPRGWRSGSLADLGRFVNGKAFTKHANGKGRPIIRIRELHGGVDDSTLRSDIGATDEHLARVDDILFAWSGSLGVSRWMGPEVLINQHIFKVLPERLPAWFVYFWIQHHMAEFQAIARDKATTMGHIQRRHLAEAGVPLPDDAAICAARDLLDPIDQQRAALAAEVRTLHELRDALLPKLISGEIRVPDTSDTGEVIVTEAETVAAAAL